jgi:N-acetylated-alpha-linked acidic dipeptidase
MTPHRSFPLLVAVALTASCLLVPAAGAATRLDRAIDRLVTQGYPQRLERALCAYGDSPMGFRTGGSPAGNACARRIAREMRAAGLTHVRLEPIAIDAWEFHGASVSVGRRVMPASAFTCVPGTPPAGLTGQLVYAGRGTAAEFDRLGDVGGKIVVIDFTDDHSEGTEDCWSSYPTHEATIRGAKAVVLTVAADNEGFFTDHAKLGGNDGEFDPSWATQVFVCGDDGDWLKKRLTSGPTKATVKLDARLTTAAEGGIGYNVAGVIPGRVKNGEKVLSVAHYDAFFRGAVDNTTAVVAQLVMARAMKLAGYAPRRTMVFLSVTGEEGAQADTWYDWCYGSWYAATKTHPSWPGHVAGVVNVEGAGAAGGVLTFGVSPELVPLLEDLVAANPGDAGPGGESEVYPVIDCGSDHWSFSARGIPAVSLWAFTDDWYPANYHTPNDAPSKVDWRCFTACVKMLQKSAVALDRRLLPYSLSARAAHLLDSLDAEQLAAAGASPAAIERVMDAAGAFATAAGDYDARAAAIPRSSRPKVSHLLLQVEKALHAGFTALDWNDETVYPHEQVLWDVQLLQQAQAALLESDPDEAAAYEALAAIGYTWYGLRFSLPVYRHQLAWHDPAYWAINWGGEGHLPMPIDVLAECRAVEMGDSAAALPGVEGELERQRAQLDDRLVTMAATLKPLPAQIAAMH